MSDATDSAVARDPRARRLRMLSIAAIVVVGALVLLSTTQPWWTITVTDRDIEVQGTRASPALSALALSSFALAAALAIAGPVFRVILGVLQALIGFTIVFAGLTSVLDPGLASASLITTATGVAGEQSVADLIEGVSLTAWPWVGVAAGVLAFLAGVFVLSTFRRWPVASRKYSAVRFDDPSAPRTSVGDWDALSDGDDPTK